MTIVNIVWNVFGLIFLVSLFGILYLVKRGAFLVIDDEEEIEDLKHS